MTDEEVDKLIDPAIKNMKRALQIAARCASLLRKEHPDVAAAVIAELTSFWLLAHKPKEGETYRQMLAKLTRIMAGMVGEATARNLKVVEEPERRSKVQ